MAYNTVAIKKDVDNKPIPQYYNPLVDAYEVLQGRNGANKVELYDANGNPIDLVGLITAIIDILNARNLPLGASTEEKQAAILTAINTVIQQLQQATVKVIESALPSGAATEVKQDEIKTIVNNIYNKDITRTFYGKSSDTKPTTGLNKGDTFFEIDTKTVYMWDGTGWVML